MRTIRCSCLALCYALVVCCSAASGAEDSDAPRYAVVAERVFIKLRTTERDALVNQLLQTVEQRHAV